MHADDRQLDLLDLAAPSDCAWRVRSSERARRLTVRVLPGGLVEIVVPRGTRPCAVEQFVTRHRRWIERTLDLYRPAEASGADGLPSRIHFPATGRKYVVLYGAGGSPPRLYAGDGSIRLTGPADRPALLRHALQRFLMRESHATLGQWLSQLSTATGLRFQRLQIRRQRTRWGSCSRNGTISLNACLLFQRAEVVRYLLFHELAHTRHMNHSRRFWRLVQQLEPQWRDFDAALTRGWREVPSWAIV